MGHHRGRRRPNLPPNVSREGVKESLGGLITSGESRRVDELLLLSQKREARLRRRAEDEARAGTHQHKWKDYKQTHDGGTMQLCSHSSAKCKSVWRVIGPDGEVWRNHPDL